MPRFVTTSSHGQHRHTTTPFRNPVCVMTCTTCTTCYIRHGIRESARQRRPRGDRGWGLPNAIVCIFLGTPDTISNFPFPYPDSYQIRTRFVSVSVFSRVRRKADFLRSCDWSCWRRAVGEVRQCWSRAVMYAPCAQSHHPATALQSRATLHMGALGTGVIDD